MRVWVTGAAGFVGGHAIAELRSAGHEVVAMVAPGQDTAIPGSLATEAMDLAESERLADFVVRQAPDACLHLAGIAFVPWAWEHPQETIRVNVIGTLNLLEAFRVHRPSARFLTVTSAQIYGHIPRAAPIREEDPPVADSVYSVSKWSADCCTQLYAGRYGLHAMTARPCNHIGPGQSESFVVSAFTRQLIEMERGLRPPRIRVGNLESLREFTDVRDIVRAYRLLLEKGRAGRAYNVASGHLIRIRELFDRLCALVGTNPDVEVDPALYRPTDAQPDIDTSRLREDTGWQTEIPLEETLRDIVADFRARMPQATAQ
ncbi:MAG TPA: GDP-mannose 4,6-dehydratase [Kiritimatiellia bacterium]|nr:GDP-mannose 4,6-dehydratase [Kiritimatiellia bacterium]HMO99662.1 GDP-mannose 4,6-dehydratase [Kiritimatiellia bacterium]HMP96164.1 GDP-mannose 4,6-dehydratase [Kiritimatiellia bacterium]